jgi:hypothetical protein
VLNEDLEPEQEDLLKAMVEASRNVPRDQRGEFHELRDGDGSSIMHPGLPGQEMRIPDGDLDSPLSGCGHRPPGQAPAHAARRAVPTVAK